MRTFTRAQRVSLSTLLQVGAALCASSAIAAQSTGEYQILQEVIVTATKRTERLQDVPISISAITAEDIETRGFTQ